MKSVDTSWTASSPTLHLRLNRHFAACSAAVACAAGVAAPQNADGAVIYSGVKNLLLPSNPAGGQLYLDFLTGNTLVGVPGQTGFDWDIAPYGGGLTNQSSYALTTVGSAGTSSNLAFGTVIDGSSTLLAAAGGIQNVGIPDQTTGIIGFKFNPASTDGFNPGANATPTNYGWFRMTVDTTTGGKVVDWAYESTPGVGITAGAVPEPSALGCLALGAAGVGIMRRRRQQAIAA